MDKKKIILTGADGFIGNHLFSFLCKDYDVFRIFYNKKAQNNERELIIDLTDKNETINFSEKVNKENNIEIIIHLASRLISRDKYDLNVFYDNSKMTESVAEMAKIVNPKKLINFSSIAVYPNKDGIYSEVSEIKPSENTECIYGLSKFCSENLFSFLLKEYNILVSNLRVSQVYGEGMRDDRIIPIMLNELKENNTITLLGRGKRISNFIKIDNLVKTVSFFCENELEGVYNIGSENIEYKELAKRIIKKYGNNSSKLEYRKGGNEGKVIIDHGKLDILKMNN